MFWIMLVNSWDFYYNELSKLILKIIQFFFKKACFFFLWVTRICLLLTFFISFIVLEEKSKCYIILQLSSFGSSWTLVQEETKTAEYVWKGTKMSVMHNKIRKEWYFQIYFQDIFLNVLLFNRVILIIVGYKIYTINKSQSLKKYD